VDALPPQASPGGRGESPQTAALSLAQAAVAFGVSVGTLRRRIRAGEIAGAYKVTGLKGDEWRLPEGSLIALGYSRQDTPQAAVEAPPASPLEAALAQVLTRFDQQQNLLEAAEADRLQAQVTAARLEAQLDAERRRSTDLEQRLEAASKKWWQRKPRPALEPPSDKPA
jgi:hypothetical protein